MTFCNVPSDDAAHFAKAGGKADQLARLQRLGFPVPAWFCLGADAMDRFLADNAFEPDPSGHEDLEAFAREVEQSFLQAPLPPELQSEVEALLDAPPFRGSPLAVRSSGLDEDSSESSFAGQYDTFLYQVGRDAVLEAIRRVWASAYSPRVVSYRSMRGVTNQGVRMGVIVQVMVDGDRAGVAFSRNPIDPLDRKHLVVSAVLGLGEGLVSGALDADHFEVDRETLESPKRSIVPKREALCRKEGGGTEAVAVPPEQAEAPSLSADQLRAVARLCLDCETKLGTPQDIEWAFAGDDLVLLQSRPITTLPPDAFFDATINGPDPTLWDNSNIIESYCGVTTPLTFSFASAAYRQVYLQFCEVMGVPQEVVDAHESVYRNMLGLLRGRIYYNLINWYRLLLLLPGAASNKAFMETMMGVKQGLRPELEGLFDFMKTPPRYSLPRQGKLLWLTMYRFARIDSIIGEFQAHFEKEYSEARTKDFGTMSLPALAAYYQHLNEQILHRWQAPIINDYSTMIFFGLLKKLTAEWVAAGKEGESLHNDLLCGEGDLESTQPTKMLMRIARDIDNGAPETRDWVLSVPAAELWRQMRDEGRSPEVKQALDIFLDRYGFRCVNELKLEEPDLHDDPSFAVQAVASYVRMKTYSIEAMEEREREIRSKAEEVVRQRVGFPRRATYFWVVRQARKAVRNRENLRFARTKIFGIVRHLFRAMGDHFVKVGVLRKPEDIFYLTVEEIFGYIEGRPNSLALAALAEIRKREFDVYRKEPAPPDRFLTYGAVGASIAFPQVLASSDLLRGQGVSDDPSLLIGIPCCPGVVEGVVRVVREMRDAEGLNGEILVTERTDPGWVPLYPSCSGLLIERGSLLSHSAVVARELGLPAVVGISGGLMRRLQTGDRVRIDGGAGEVRILS